MTTSAAPPSEPPSPLEFLYERPHDEFRERVREVTARWSEETVDGWEAAGHLPREVFAELGEAGLFRERWEAGRVEGLPLALVLAEELALVAGGLGLPATIHGEVFLGALERLAESDWQRSVLDDALDGRAVGCFASTEPHGGSDLTAIRTSIARREGKLRLSGEKRYTTNAGTGTHVIVLCRSEDHEEDRDSCLVLLPLDHPGVEVVGFFPKVGVRSSDLAALRFDAELDDEMLICKPGTGLIHATRSLQLERIAAAAQLNMAARSSLGLALSFARAREIQGARMIDLGSIRHRLADARAELWAAEALLHGVVSAALAGRDVSHQTAGAKLFCARTAGRVIDECLQVLGGRGYTENYPLERYWRDARLARIGGGSDEVMRELIAAGLDNPSPEYDEWTQRLDEHDVARPADDEMEEPNG